MGCLRDSEEGFPELQNSDSGRTHYPHPTGEKGLDSHDELKWVESGLNLDDTFPVDDGFETQVLDFGGETQLLNDSENHEDLEMTQLLDGFDDHVSIGSDGEETDATQLLNGGDDDDDNVFDGGTSGRSKEEEFLGGEKSELGGEKRLVEPPSALLNGGMSEHVEDKDGSADGHRGSGAGVRFASVRAASFRASGLAARNAALKGTNSEHSCIQLKSHSSEHVIEKINDPTLNSQYENGIACAVGRCDDEAKGLKAESNSKIGFSAVRKLFTEDSLFDETEIVGDYSEIAAGLTEVQLPCDYGLAGLSYVNSQEPGELSQANALACVQKLIDGNKELLDDELELGKSGRGMLSGVSTIKGPQSLARKANLRDTNAKGGVFDWDDRREDEGGGDFFSRRKDDLFGSGKRGQNSSTRSQKRKGNQSERCRNSQGTCHIETVSVFHTDSKILLNNSWVKGNKPDGCKLNLVRDLGDEFDKVSNVEPSGEQFESNVTGKVMEETFDIGFDTQMAAEAMEALMNREGNANGDANNDRRCLLRNTDDSGEESSRGAGRIAHPKQSFQESRSRVGASTRKSWKSEMINARLCKSSSPESEKHADNLKMQQGQDKVTTKHKKTKCAAEKVVINSQQKAVNQTPSDLESRKEAKATKSNLLGEPDFCKEAAPGGHRSVKRQHLPQDGASFTPIAHRTRGSLVQLNDAGNPHRNSGEENDNEMGDDAVVLNTASPLGGVSSKALIGKKRKSSRTKQSGEVENLTPKSTANDNEHEMGGDALELNTAPILSGLGASKALISTKRKSLRTNPSVEVENSLLKSTAKGNEHEMGGDAHELNTAASLSGLGASKALIGKRRKSLRTKPSVQVENLTPKSTANDNDHEMGGDALELNTACFSGSGASEALIGKKRKSLRTKPSVEVENSMLKSTAEGNDHEMGVDAVELNIGSLSGTGAFKALIGKERKSSKEKPSVGVENSTLKAKAKGNEPEMGVDAVDLNGEKLSGIGAKALIGKKRKSRSKPSVELDDSTLNSTARGDDMSCPRRRSNRNVSSQFSKSDNLRAHLKPSVCVVDMAKSTSRPKRSRRRFGVADAEQNLKRITQPTVSPCLDASSAGMNSKEKMLHDVTEGKPDPLPSTENENMASPDRLSRQQNKAFESACTSPARCMAPANVESPICIGDGYFKKSCKSMSRSSLLREINGLCSSGEQPIHTPKDSRKRRNLTGVKVLFSRHLNESVLKQQKKIVDRLKISVASSILDATHFIADDFVRTRNMLEAIACGKPVVTHLWLENVGRANYFIDEQEYILRDVRKEREFGFNLFVSLAHARHRPLLPGRRVFITSNVKPGKDIISSLVKAVQGQAVERVGRSSMNDNTVLDDLLILSSEEDYEVCIPFLEKGLAVYSSELLLNGIVTQKLEYERHRLFADHVKKTRSTLWVKKDGRNFVPIKKHN